jgi:hypothetical protein
MATYGLMADYALNRAGAATEAEAACLVRSAMG